MLHVLKTHMCNVYMCLPYKWLQSINDITGKVWSQHYIRKSLLGFLWQVLQQRWKEHAESNWWRRGHVDCMCVNRWGHKVWQTCNTVSQYMTCSHVCKLTHTIIIACKLTPVIRKITMMWFVCRASIFRVCIQVKVTTKDDGTKWCYMAEESVVRKKGWKEGTSGRGTKRAIEDDTFDAMCRQLKGCDWECTVTPKELKKIDATGELPAKVNTKMQLCYKAGI